MRLAEGLTVDKYRWRKKQRRRQMEQRDIWSWLFHASDQFYLHDFCNGISTASVILISIKRKQLFFFMCWDLHLLKKLLLYDIKEIVHSNLKITLIFYSTSSHPCVTYCMSETQSEWLYPESSMLCNGVRQWLFFKLQKVQKSVIKLTQKATAWSLNYKMDVKL